MIYPNQPKWKPTQTVKDVLEAIEAEQKQGCYGPFALTFSWLWEKYLDDDYSVGDRTLKQRLLEIDAVAAVVIDDKTEDLTFSFTKHGAPKLTNCEWQSVIEGLWVLGIKVRGVIRKPYARVTHNGTPLDRAWYAVALGKEIGTFQYLPDALNACEEALKVK